VPELIKLAKESATPLNYNSPGAGVAQHLSMEYMKQRFGLNMVHVPYRNTPHWITDIVAGHVQLGFAEAGASLPLIREGKLRALAVSASTRIPTLPNVPPFAEPANAPDFEAVSWHLVVAPAHTPPEIVNKLHDEIKTLVAQPEIQQQMIKMGLIPVDTPSVEQLQNFVASEIIRWGKLVQQAGIAGSQ